MDVSPVVTTGLGAGGLRPPPSYYRTRRFRQDLHRRLTLPALSRAATPNRVGDNGRAALRLAERIQDRHGFRLKGSTHAAGRERPSGRQAMVYSLPPELVAGQVEATFARRSEAITAPEPLAPRSLGVPVERERADFGFPLSRPPVPLASWLGTAPPTPERAERQPFPAAVRTAVPETAPAFVPPALQNPPDRPMAADAVLWRRSAQAQTPRLGMPLPVSVEQQAAEVQLPHVSEDAPAQPKSIARSIGVERREGTESRQTQATAPTTSFSAPVSAPPSDSTQNQTRYDRSDIETERVPSLPSDSTVRRSPDMSLASVGVPETDVPHSQNAPGEADPRDAPHSALRLEAQVAPPQAIAEAAVLRNVESAGEDDRRIEEITRPIRPPQLPLSSAGQTVVSRAPSEDARFTESGPVDPEQVRGQEARMASIDRPALTMARITPATQVEPMPTIAARDGERPILDLSSKQYESWERPASIVGVPAQATDGTVHPARTVERELQLAPLPGQFSDRTDEKTAFNDLVGAAELQSDFAQTSAPRMNLAPISTPAVLAPMDDTTASNSWSPQRDSAAVGQRGIANIGFRSFVGERFAALFQPRADWFDRLPGALQRAPNPAKGLAIEVRWPGRIDGTGKQISAAEQVQAIGITKTQLSREWGRAGRLVSPSTVSTIDQGMSAAPVHDHKSEDSDRSREAEEAGRALAFRSPKLPGSSKWAAVTPSRDGVLPFAARQEPADTESVPWRSEPRNPMAERAPVRLYPAAGGGVFGGATDGLLIQRSAAGSGPEATGPAAAAQAQEAGAGAADPAAGANDVQLLANEVWSLLKRRLTVEAERRGG